jgi:plasmid stability protein
MKNITVSVDDETYRRARIKAAERDTSVSALVREFLQSLSRQESEFDRLAREEQELYVQIENFSDRYNLPRDDVHERGI